MTIQNQQGIALIPVLLFLILITIAGTIAIRQSATDLRVARSEQASLIMQNTSDNVLAYVEDVGNRKVDDAEYKKIMSQTKGVLGFFIPAGNDSSNINEKADVQVRFCYTPKTKEEVFDIQNARILYPDGGTIRKSAGACDPKKADEYISSRNTVITQVVVRGLTNDSVDSQDFGAVIQGNGISLNNTNPSPRVAVNSISMIPAMSDVSAGTVKDCMDLPVGDKSAYGAKTNLTGCLQEEGVPATALVEEGTIMFNKNKCDVATAVATGECKVI